ncbi:MAG: DUF1343 domain-containing protein, partial [Ignavibacteriae bacterium]|nr:DUF1343 domain-containing protein [Ignavibacteriota bacterium]
SHFDRLWGSKSLREMILNRKTPEEILNSFKKDLDNFKTDRKEFLLYE